MRSFDLAKHFRKLRFIHLALIFLLILLVTPLLLLSLVNETDLHWQHDLVAKMGMLKEWTAMRYSQTCAKLPPLETLQHMQTLRFRNLGFEEGLAGWKTASGHPVVITSSDAYEGQSYFLGGPAPDYSGASDQEEYPRDRYSHIYQTVSISSPLYNDLIDKGQIVIVAEGYLRRPPIDRANSSCFRDYPKSFCQHSYDDVIFYRLSFYDQRERNAIGSLRSAVASHTVWKRYSLTGVVPAGTRAIRLEVISRHRAGPANDGAADNFAAALYVLPGRVAGLRPRITKLPMVRYHGNHDELVVVWETDGNLAHHRAVWGWTRPESSRHGDSPQLHVVTPNADTPYEACRLETTEIDNCHYVHKAVFCLSPWSTTGSLDAELVKLQRTVRYRVMCGDDVTEPLEARRPAALSPLAPYFVATASRTATFAAVVVGDSQSSASVFRHIVTDAAWLRKPDLFIHAGDVVATASDLAEWHTNFFKPLEGGGHFGSRVPLVVAKGNHDGEHPLAHAYLDGPEAGEIFSETDAGRNGQVSAGQRQRPRANDVGERDWFAFTVDGVRFIILDSNAHHEAVPQQTLWLRRELRSNASRHADFRVVLTHLPPFTELWDPRERYVGEPFVRDVWVPLFEKYNVDIVISGHTHGYLRGKLNGVTYTVVGGGGGVLDEYRVADWEFFDKVLVAHHYAVLRQTGSCALAWRAYDLNDNLIDSFDLMCMAKGLGQVV